MKLSEEEKEKYCSLNISDLDEYRYIPLRLTEDERKYLNVLESALEVVEYTENVDIEYSYSFSLNNHHLKGKNKKARVLECLNDLFSITSGLMVAINLQKGENLILDKNFEDNTEYFKTLFEIGRRYKVMNPSKMRGTYGKLMYILMDISLYLDDTKGSYLKQIYTVHKFLSERKLEYILHDPLWKKATMTFHSHDQTSYQAAKTSKEKALAAEELIDKYSGDILSTDDIRRIIDSIADNEAYYAFNVRPVKKMLQLLQENFDKEKSQDPFSLSLSWRPSKIFDSINPSHLFSSSSSSYTSSTYGNSLNYSSGGAQLSHNHSTQYKFVLQSLTLWAEIMRNMPMLWINADCDMILESYRLVNTGQGLHRLQSCPRVAKKMRSILTHVQSKFNSWVGLSVVHLGDRDVPNALVFIDKYAQIPSILSPIVNCVDSLPSLVEDHGLHKFVGQEWGTVENLRLQILSDFFKHGFDGSGDDGGSCIDGRLTSAWNWCSKIEKKPFYHIFMLTGFFGFDGEWKSK